MPPGGCRRPRRKEREGSWDPRVIRVRIVARSAVGPVVRVAGVGSAGRVRKDVFRFDAVLVPVFVSGVAVGGVALVEGGGGSLHSVESYPRP